MNGYGQIRLYEGRGVIDAVPDHGDLMPLPLKSRDIGRFVLGHLPAMGLTDADPLTDGFGGFITIP